MDLFIYGTLQSAALMQAVAGKGFAPPVPARLPGYAVRKRHGNVVPYITADADAVTEGVVFARLDPSQIARLDLYEGAFWYQLTPVTVQTDAGDRPVQVYLPAGDNATGDDAWSFAQWQAEHETPAVFAATELFAHDPLPDHAALRRMWPMMEGRAWAKHRAALTPATVRHAARSTDMTIRKARPPVGSFFRMQNLDVTHRRFSGAESGVMHREVFVGVDAVILLPYDPVRDKVLLVEQARMGPVLRNDPNPWMLEPIAGMIDARETPQAAVRREAVEEANIALRHLEPAGSYYTSPGGTTDYYYTYVGLCDLPMTESYLGGLPEENEDLRLHPLGFDAAMALLNSGEIATGPLFHLLYWLGWHRDRLRQSG